jgi:hypothetical protein
MGFSVYRSCAISISLSSLNRDGRSITDSRLISYFSETDSRGGSRDRVLVKRKDSEAKRIRAPNLERLDSRRYGANKKNY